jgi:hypothetical protein
LPGYILCGLASQNILFPEKMAVSFIFMSAIAPIGAALILISRQKEKGRIKKLLKRTFDYKRIKNKIWYMPIIILMPFIFAFALIIMKFLGFTIPNSMLPLAAIPVFFILIFILAIGEEIGWMGYIFKPMQNHYNTFKATLLLGLIWATWHIPFYFFTGGVPVFITTQFVFLVSTRFIMVWIFNHSGESLFAMILFHAVFNVCIGAFPNYQVNPQLGVIVTTFLVFLFVIILKILKRAGNVKISI